MWLRGESIPQQTDGTIPHPNTTPHPNTDTGSTTTESRAGTPDTSTKTTPTPQTTTPAPDNNTRTPTPPERTTGPATPPDAPTGTADKVTPRAHINTATDNKPNIAAAQQHTPATTTTGGESKPATTVSTQPTTPPTPTPTPLPQTATPPIPAPTAQTPTSSAAAPNHGPSDLTTPRDSADPVDNPATPNAPATNTPAPHDKAPTTQISGRAAEAPTNAPSNRPSSDPELPRFPQPPDRSPVQSPGMAGKAPTPADHDRNTSNSPDSETTQDQLSGAISQDIINSLVKLRETSTVTVVGQGIAGVLTAHNLARRGYHVKVVTKGGEPTSVAAGAQFLPWVPKKMADSLYRSVGNLEEAVSVGRSFYERLAQNPELTGVMRVKNYEFAGPEKWPDDLASAMRAEVITLDEPIELPGSDGEMYRADTMYVIDSYSIDTPKTLRFLKHQAAEEGARFEEKTVTMANQDNRGPSVFNKETVTLADLATTSDAVVVAIGDGARELMNNPNFENIKGHVIRLRLRDGTRLQVAVSADHLIILPTADEHEIKVGAWNNPDPRTHLPEKEDAEHLLKHQEQLIAATGALLGIPVDLLEEAEVVSHHAGQRSKYSGGIFIEDDDYLRNVLHFNGLYSTGWSLSPLLSEFVAEEIDQKVFGRRLAVAVANDPEILRKLATLGDTVSISDLTRIARVHKESVLYATDPHGTPLAGSFPIRGSDGKTAVLLGAGLRFGGLTDRAMQDLSIDGGTQFKQLVPIDDAQTVRALRHRGWTVTGLHPGSDSNTGSHWIMTCELTDKAKVEITKDTGAVAANVTHAADLLRWRADRTNGWLRSETLAYEADPSHLEFIPVAVNAGAEVVVTATAREAVMAREAKVPDTTPILCREVGDIELSEVFQHQNICVPIENDSDLGAVVAAVEDVHRTRNPKYRALVAVSVRHDAPDGHANLAELQQHLEASIEFSAVLVQRPSHDRGDFTIHGFFSKLTRELDHLEISPQWVLDRDLSFEKLCTAWPDLPQKLPGESHLVVPIGDAALGHPKWPTGSRWSPIDSAIHVTSEIYAVGPEPDNRTKPHTTTPSGTQIRFERATGKWVPVDVTLAVVPLGDTEADRLWASRLKQAWVGTGPDVARCPVAWHKNGVIAIDVTRIPNVAPGDRVDLLGPTPDQRRQTLNLLTGPAYRGPHESTETRRQAHLDDFAENHTLSVIDDGRVLRRTDRPAHQDSPEVDLQTIGDGLEQAHWLCQAVMPEPPDLLTIHQMYDVARENITIVNDGDRVVGFAMVAKVDGQPTAEVLALAVHPDYPEIGRRLLLDAIRPHTFQDVRYFHVSLHPHEEHLRPVFDAVKFDDAGVDPESGRRELSLDVVDLAEVSVKFDVSTFVENVRQAAEFSKGNGLFALVADPHVPAAAIKEAAPFVDEIVAQDPDQVRALLRAGLYPDETPVVCMRPGIEDDIRELVGLEGIALIAHSDADLDAIARAAAQAECVVPVGMILRDGTPDNNSLGEAWDRNYREGNIVAHSAMFEYDSMANRSRLPPSIESELFNLANRGFRPTHFYTWSYEAGGGLQHRRRDVKPVAFMNGDSYGHSSVPVCDDIRTPRSRSAQRGRSAVQATAKIFATGFDRDGTPIAMIPLGPGDKAAQLTKAGAVYVGGTRVLIAGGRHTMLKLSVPEWIHLEPGDPVRLFDGTPNKRWTINSDSHPSGHSPSGDIPRDMRPSSTLGEWLGGEYLLIGLTLMSNAAEQTSPRPLRPRRSMDLKHAELTAALHADRRIYVMNRGWDGDGLGFEYPGPDGPVHVRIGIHDRRNDPQIVLNDDGQRHVEIDVSPRPSDPNALASEIEDKVYRLLESRMLSWQHDCSHIPVFSDGAGSELVIVPPSEALRVGGAVGEIMLRREVSDRLHDAARRLREVDPRLQLEVVDGDRPSAEYDAIYHNVAAQLRPSIPGSRLIDAVSILADGHPTGATVDVRVLCDGEPVDMGSRVFDYGNRNTLAHWPFVSADAWTNRQLLRDAMRAAGFAPNERAWHKFSFGDKQQAAHDGLDHAQYGPWREQR
ncbi:FAD-dependent oxidoreductase [Nocardia sp. CA-107356]|uniref:FAD-dependent oxidoreductase n=1 Tax=Nocardia sp. CA-107356 TaxID=3239972 RepID=UPI003D90AEAE